VILIGGGSRVPRVQEILTEYVGRELGKNMNTDESAAMGAVYKAADLSTGMMMYDHRDADPPPPPISSTRRDGR
jgi:hypoxia up-regulated 1